MNEDKKRTLHQELTIWLLPLIGSAITIVGIPFMVYSYTEFRKAAEFQAAATATQQAMLETMIEVKDTLHRINKKTVDNKDAVSKLRQDLPLIIEGRVDRALRRNGG